jgi:hypothetical protein
MPRARGTDHRRGSGHGGGLREAWAGGDYKQGELGESGNAAGPSAVDNDGSGGASASGTSSSGSDDAGLTGRFEAGAEVSSKIMVVIAEREAHRPQTGG